MVILLVKNGADESIKDKEGHTSSDFDFHSDADTDVLMQEEQAGNKRDTGKHKLKTNQNHTRNCKWKIKTSKSS